MYDTEAVAMTAENGSEGSHEDIEAQLLAHERATPPVTEADEPDGREVVAQMPTAAEIDWPALWTEFNIDANKPQSGTQLSLLIEATEQTPQATGEHRAAALVEDALEAGYVTELSKQRFVYTEGANEQQ
jgi:hypothetical protein